ncbi:unnamed protein product [Debaryomyces tyrocola]|nr:unnamed protein product [Debaryomyces tyrocola]
MVDVDNHCTRPSAPSVREKDSPESGLRDGGLPGERHEGCQSLKPGAMALFSDNLNHVILAGLKVVRLFKGSANNSGGGRSSEGRSSSNNSNFNRRPSTYFRGVQTYLTCVQCSKYMAELVYMTLVKSLYTDPATLALTELPDSYGDDIVFGNPSLYLAEWVRFQKPSTYSSQSWNSQLGKDTVENYILQLYIVRKREEKKSDKLRN